MHLSYCTKDKTSPKLLLHSQTADSCSPQHGGLEMLFLRNGEVGGWVAILGEEILCVWWEGGIET